MKKSVIVLIFISIFMVIYVLALVAMSKLRIKDVSLLQRITNCYIEPGGWGQTLRRFREVDNVKNTDILFLGSSHAYRAFDPRYFASYGYTSFNMGSSSQTPLNSYYLVKKYFKQLCPKLVVLEVYPLLLSKDGMESYYDLVTNTSITYEIVAMAFALRSPHAIHILMKNVYERLQNPLNNLHQQEIKNEKYIAGGYCETKLLYNKSKSSNGVHTITPTDNQLYYLRKIIEYVKLQESNIIIVTQPLPSEYLKTTHNYNEISEKLTKIANDLNIRYIDYSKTAHLNFMTDFYDNDHLTANGVIKFNSLLLQDLISDNIIFKK